MSGEPGTLRLIAEHLAGAVAPLDRVFREESRFRALMRELGWSVGSLPPSYASVADAAAAASRSLAALAEDADLVAILGVVDSVGAAYQAIRDLDTAPAGVDATAFLADLDRAILERLLVDQLRLRAPGCFSTLEALGVIGFDHVASSGGRPGHVRARFDWALIPATLSDPTTIPQAVYDWGGATFDFNRVAEVLHTLFAGRGRMVSIDRTSSELSDGLQSEADGTPAAPIRSGFTVPFFHRLVGDDLEDVGFAINELPAEGATLPGIVIRPLVPEGTDPVVDLGDGWRFEVRPGSELADPFGIVLRSDGIAVRYPFAPGQPFAAGGFGASMVYDPESPGLLFGEPGGTRVEFTGGTLSADLDLVAGELELKITAAPTALTLVLSTGELDGFLAGALGVDETRVEIPFALSWSNRTGLDFTAGLGFEVSLYPHLDVGVLRFDRVDLAVRFVTTPTPSLALQSAVSFSGQLGPIAYIVERVGVELPVTFADGNAGPFDVQIRPLWPTGLGLVIDAGLVTGGGFVSFDPTTGRYVGAIELDLFGIGIAAIGILDTLDAAGNALPPPGFSFLIIVSVELPPIQLGFGFTLNGVGGLAAVNRRLSTDALLAGVREGSLEGVMFPEDPVRDAPLIASNLSEIFPVAMGRYVFGPMALIGWGTPALIEVELGVVVEVPDPIVIALIGTASAALPTEDVAIVALNLDVVGVLDLGQSLLAVDASLRDSYVAAYSIAGDLAMRLYFGADPSFALAVGGMNPHFTDAPPAFPSLRRVSVSLGLGDNPRVSLEAYFAVTANSLQFGARAELYVEEAGFSVFGWVGFDVLVTLRPFSFRFDFSAGMTLNRGDARIAGITINGHLTGPSPFHVWGSGAVSTIFGDIRVPFDATFGAREEAPALPAADPWPPLEAALELGENWSAELPIEAVPAVTLLPPGGTDRLLLHPMGEATVRQKVVPLHRTLERFGEYAISGPDRFDVSEVRVGSRPASSWSVVTDHFPPGDFEKLSETEKLSRDSFELMDAGVGVGGDLLDAPTAAMKTASLDYETKIIDAPWRSRRVAVYRLPRGTQHLLGATGSKATSGLSRRGSTLFARTAGRPPAVVLGPERYAVATQDTLAARPDVAVGVTKGVAALALKHASATTAEGLQVVPEHELEPVGSGAPGGGGGQPPRQGPGRVEAHGHGSRRGPASRPRRGPRRPPREGGP